MKRKILSYLLVLVLFMGIIPVSASATFTDISDPNTAIAAAVLESMDIVDGTSANTFSPYSNLTRAQFCALAVRTMGLDDNTASHSYKTLFSDVKPGKWYTGYVNLAYSEGIVNGYGNGKFGPNDSVTYGQVATILLRLLNYSSAEIGNVWPKDYVNYANDLELSEGLTLSENSNVTRGQAAILLYNTLGTEKNGTSTDYYQTLSDVASMENVVILDNDATNTGMLMVCRLFGENSTIEYYTPDTDISDALVGHLGTLLLNKAQKSIGFMPSSNKFEDITVSSAKSSGITSDTGRTYRVTSSTQVIHNGSIYSYNSSGYIQVDNQSGRNVRLFYNDDGAISYVYITAGTSSSGTDAAVAETNSAASELARYLGISATSYSISKNGASASSNDIAKYDVAYYDNASNTMRVSDYRVTGYIASAYPNVSAAETITISGCTLGVLESAWNTLSSFSLGTRVVLLLTDDCKVAAAYSYSDLDTDMMGILSIDGKSITLAPSGIILKPDAIDEKATLRGKLVKVTISDKTSLKCSELSTSSAKVNITSGTIGSYDIAPGCAIYEWTGNSYVCSLSGIQGESSAGFDEIKWTESLASSYVSYYRLNSAGQADILLLKNATGNCYDYGKVKVYDDDEGISFGVFNGQPIYNTAATITNSKYPSESNKYLYNYSNSYPPYKGIALTSYDDMYMRIASISDLTASSSNDAGAFFKNDDDWYVTISDYEVPISENVEVYVDSFEKWSSGEDGLLSAISSELPLTLYYDRSFTTGAQVRVIVIKTN